MHTVSAQQLRTIDHHPPDAGRKLGNYKIDQDELGRITFRKSKVWVLALGIVGILALLTGLVITAMICESIYDGEPNIRAIKGAIVYLVIGTLCSLFACDVHTIVIDTRNRSVELHYLMGLYRRVIDSREFSHVGLRIDELAVQGYTVQLARNTAKEIDFGARAHTRTTSAQRLAQFACWLACALGVDLVVEGEARERDEKLTFLMDIIQTSGGIGVQSQML